MKAMKIYSKSILTCYTLNDKTATETESETVFIKMFLVSEINRDCPDTFLEFVTFILTKL